MEPAASLNVIAVVHSDFPEKFGIPRRVDWWSSCRRRSSLSHPIGTWTPSRAGWVFPHLAHLGILRDGPPGMDADGAAPPRLGGNARMGVFATRSPFRPNPIGLSCVRLREIQLHPELGPVLHIAGADLMDGTPIYDIKPYIPYVDCHPEATGGFAAAAPQAALEVSCPPALLEQIPPDRREALLGVLALDPRPAYQHDSQRVYGLSFAGMDVRFSVSGSRLTVLQVLPLEAP